MNFPPPHFYERDGSPRPHASSCHFRQSPRVDPTGGSTAFPPSKFQIDFAGALNSYKSQNIYERGYVAGPVYPIDAFSERDQDLLRSAVAESMLRVHRIGDRLYATGRDIDAFMAWTCERVVRPQRWQENLGQVTAALDGIERLHLSAPVICFEPSLGPDDGERTCIPPRSARQEMRGPIAPVDHFANDLQQILDWCIRDGLVRSVVLDGITYVSYSDVYGALLSDHFESELDDPAAWDGTYAPAWSSWRRVKAQWVKPRGFKDAVRSDMFPRISVHRETRHVDKGAESHFVKAAYPKHVANGAAALFRALYREEGFAERFRIGQCFDDEKDVVEPLTIFEFHEAEWFRTFAAEGGIRLYKLRDGEYIARSELMYYDLFAAKIIEDEFDLDFDTGPGVNSTIEVMLDGTFCRGGPFGPRTPLRRKRDIGTDR